MPSIKKLDLQAVKNLYETRMKKDFPPSELRPLQSIEKMMRENKCLAYGYFEGSELLAYAFFTLSGSSRAVLLDYYAVSEACRGTGIGSAFLADFKQALAPLHIQYVLLEVESIEAAENETESEIRKRRIRFYEKNGVVMSGVSSWLFGVDYSVMYLSFDAEKRKDAEVKEELEQVYYVIISSITGEKTGHEKYGVVTINKN